MIIAKDNKFDSSSARQLNPLVLASIGDAVYSLLIRTHIVANHDLNAHKLHSCAAHLVCAVAQKDAFYAIENALTEDEAYIAKRGRNSHPPTIPKNADISDYRTATALEAVFGYLYLISDEKRIEELFNLILEKENEKQL